MSTKTLGGRAADVAFKTFTGALFATTVITGGWFAATSFSAASHYDKLEREHKAREMRLAEERAAEEASARSGGGSGGSSDDDGQTRGRD